MDYSDIFEELNNIDEDYLCEMASARKEDTHLPYDLWIDSLGKDRKNTHNEARIKIEVNGKLIPITITDNPSIPQSALKNMGRVYIPHFSEVKKYIIAYKDVLKSHYNREINDRQLLSLLSDIKDADKANRRLKDEIL